MKHDDLLEALEWLVQMRPYPSAECWANAEAAIAKAKDES
jgi:hypothetical protein